VAQAITHITNANVSSVAWFSDGVAYEGQDDILSALNAAQDLRILQGTQQVIGLTPAQYVDGTINVTTVRANAFGDEAVTILAQGRDPLGYNATLTRVTAQFSGRENMVNAPLVLPAELRARVKSFEIEGIRSAGARTLVDNTFQRREVALVAGRRGREGLELLSPLHYLNPLFLT
jgi:hypothetical protein